MGIFIDLSRSLRLLRLSALALLSIALCSCSRPLTTDQKLTLAADMMEKNEWQKASRELSALLKKKPTNTAAKLLLALCLEQEGKLDEAADLARQAAEVRRNDFTALYTSARLNFLTTPDRRDTFEMLEKACRLRPNDLNTIILLCNTGTRINHPRVLTYLQKLQRHGSFANSGVLDYQFGSYFAASGNHRQAFEYFDRAIRRCKDQPEIIYYAALRMDRAQAPRSRVDRYYRDFLNAPGNKDRSHLDEATRRLQRPRRFRRR